MKSIENTEKEKTSPKEKGKEDHENRGIKLRT